MNYSCWALQTSNQAANDENGHIIHIVKKKNQGIENKSDMSGI